MYKKRRAVKLIETMGEVEGERELKVRDHRHLFKGVAGLVRENFLAGCHITTALWEDYHKFSISQAELFVSQVEKLGDFIIESDDNFRLQMIKPWKELLIFLNQYFQKITHNQRDLTNEVLKITDRFIKDALGMIRGNIESTR